MGEAMPMENDFHGEFLGAKVGLFIGDKLLVILRDDDPSIPFPNVWDFPGGGREKGETPFETVAREVKEEVGLDLPRGAIIWEREYPSTTVPDATSWFFVAKMPAGTEAKIVFGDEGQSWELMTEGQFASLPNHYHAFAARLADWHAALGI